MRTDFESRPTGGLQRLFEMHALLPRLGFFAAAPGGVPYDYPELLRSIKPRPTLLHTPSRDRDANATEVDACIQAVKWAALTQTRADTPSQMATAESDGLAAWLKKL